MRQLVFVEPRRLEWREVCAPRVEAADQAIVRPLAVTRCDLDLYIATGLFPMKGPFAFGHEIAGEVVDIGDEVTSVAPGDRVIVPFQINCGSCRMCRRGLTNSCRSVPAYSAYGLAPSSGREWGGGLSDLVLVPYADAMLVAVPDCISLPAAAAISDNATDGFRTVAKPLSDQPGSDILIVGGLAQSVGLFAVQAARGLGARRVVYRDYDVARLTMAKALGAEVVETVYSPDLRADERFPIVVEAGGVPDSLIFSLRSTEPCGVCTGVSAGVGGMAKVPLRQMYMKGITYTVGRVHARGCMNEVLDNARRGRIKPDKVISREVPFSEAADAMTDSDIKLVFLSD